MSRIEDSLSHACSAVPGLLTGALVLVPEGLLIGGVGVGSAFDHEPLVRSAASVTSERCAWPGPDSRPAFVQYAFISEEQLVVILRGQRFPRVALAVSCTREANLALVLGSTRQALQLIEADVDLTPWEV